MLKTYFTIAFRNLKKHKVFSFVNITGLAVGLTVFWLMALYIADEYSYDRQDAHADRIYRVVHTAEWPTGKFRLAPTSMPFAPALKKDYSEIEDAARIDVEGGGTLLYQEKKFEVNDIAFADNSLLHVFQYPFLYGDPGNALNKPQSIVLTQSLAEKIFGSAENALHKTLSFQNDAGPVEVTGVMKDIPGNTHLRFSALRSLQDNNTEGWQNFHVYTYLLLHDGADVKKLEARLPSFYERYLRPAMGEGIHYNMLLQPITSIHLHSNMEYEIGRNGDIRYVYLFSAVALLVLIIAVINYINLATARSSIRVKEIGVRKVIGSGRKQLVWMFLSESVLFTLISATVAITLAGILMPLFNQVSGKSLSVWQFGTVPTLGGLLAFSLLTGLAGGIYPALFLSGFRTIPALKGQQGNLQGNILFRKSLVSFQFIIAIVLIAGSVILYQQLHFMLNKDLGFNKDQVMTFHIPNPALRTKIADLKTRLLQNPLVQQASGASIAIGRNNIGSNGFRFEENGAIATSARKVQNYFVDADYLNTMEIRLLQGRNFSADRPADQYGSVLVNETLVKELGWKEPLGKRVQFKTDQEGRMGESLVIGVVKDFNIYSLQHKIEPLILQMPPVLREEDNCYVRVNRSNIPAAVRYIESTYHSFDASSPFEYRFLDENFAAQYASEEKQGRILFIFTTLAIFIACLGLFGLVTFAVQQRTKEIGIRKVLGSGITGIVTLVAKDLIRPVILAILVATPISWYAMHRWLEGFAYHINISVWVFPGAGVLALVIAMATVSFRAIRAAMANPVKSLRSE